VLPSGSQGLGGTTYKFHPDESIFHWVLRQLFGSWALNVTPAAIVAGPIEAVVTTRALIATDIGITRGSLSVLEGTVIESGTTRILQVENLRAATQLPVGEVRSALGNIVQQATADGMKTLQIVGRFANERLADFVFKQASALGGQISASGGVDTITFVLAK
jgi:hypothetical protein